MKNKLPDSAEVITESKTKQFFLRLRSNAPKLIKSIAILIIAPIFLVGLIRYFVYVWELMF